MKHGTAVEEITLLQFGSVNKVVPGEAHRRGRVGHNQSRGSRDTVKGRLGTSTKRARMVPTFCCGGKSIRVSHVTVSNSAGFRGAPFEERPATAARR